jgi:acylaminoacyl-peptidase
MNPGNSLYDLAKEIAGTPTFISIQKSSAGWEIIYSVDSFAEENSTKSELRKFVSVYSQEFKFVSSFELSKEVKFRQIHPNKNITVTGKLFKKDNSSRAEISIAFENGIVNKKLEGVTEFYADSYFASPNPWFLDKYFLFIGEKKLEGSDFLYCETFGERYDDKRCPTLILLNLDTFDLKEIPIDGFYPMSPVFISDDVIMLQGYPMESHKLGIKYCLNRPTQIILYNLKLKSIEIISDPKNSARSPRLVESFVYFLEGPLYYSHFPACDLICYDIESKSKNVISKILEKDYFEELLPFQSNCKSLIINPIIGTVKKPFTLGLNTIPLECEGVVIAAVDDYVFIDKGYLSSSINKVDHRLFVKKNQSACASIFKNIDSSKLKGIEMTIKNKSPNCEMILFKIKNARNSKVILWPHGGPNSSCMDHDNEVLPILLNAGYDVARINYTGSCGYSREAIEELVIGQQDIEDTFQIATDLGHSYNKLVMLGGSHGGFISATMIGKYPEMFSAAVLMNPVIDLYSMIQGSDIYDWSFGQLQQPFSLERIYTDLDFLKMLRDASPARYAQNIKCPILLLLGEKDRRVPMTAQGLFLRKLVNPALIKTLIYSDSDHSLDSNTSRWDVPFQILDFLKEMM